MGIIDQLIDGARQGVEARRHDVPQAELESRLSGRGEDRPFSEALTRPGLSLIAEFKRRSPSRGDIAADADVAAQVLAYERGGAAALSVLTDEPHFGGSLEDLRTARESCGLPIVRKDFIVDPYQVVEARAWGADCILLIMDAAPDAELARLESLAHGLGMDVLVESHDAAQLDRALRLATPLVGVNNRDLRTFAIRLETTLELAGRVPAGRILVAESGIASPEAVKRLRDAKVSAYLVGGAFMAAADPGAELSRLFGRV